MGILVIMSVGFLAVAFASSQLPAWVAIAVYVANLAVYLWVWDFHPFGFAGGGSQTIHVVILIGGQTAHMLGLFLPLFTDVMDSWPRGVRALAVGVATLPLWLLIPLAFYV